MCQEKHRNGDLSEKIYLVNHNFKEIDMTNNKEPDQFKRSRRNPIALAH